MNQTVVTYQPLKDFAQLVKLRLSLTVVFSSAIAFAIAAGSAITFKALLVLSLGGFFVTSASNILNEVLEKDYDRMMARTQNRPLVTGRISVSTAVLMAGLFLMTGLTLLSMFNALTGLLGVIAFILYAFVYTPYKRISVVAVYIGAIPGALPTMIGVVAVHNELSDLALFLFGLQLVWQLPHFWSIGWLAYEDYRAAGFKFLPDSGEKADNTLGGLAFYSSIALFPLLILGFMNETIGVFTLISGLALSFFYSYYSFLMKREATRPSSLKVMFYSFLYLPAILIVLLIETLV